MPNPTLHVVDPLCRARSCRYSLEYCTPYGCQLVPGNTPENWFCPHPMEDRKEDGTCGICREKVVMSEW